MQEIFRLIAWALGIHVLLAWIMISVISDDILDPKNTAAYSCVRNAFFFTLLPEQSLIDYIKSTPIRDSKLYQVSYRCHSK